MTNPATGPAPDPTASPLVPPIPSTLRRRAKRSRKKDQRPLVWAVAFAAGLVLGTVAYQWIPGVDATFEYWVALVIG